MIRRMLMAVALLGLMVVLLLRWIDVYTSSQPVPVTRVDVYADRITYRNRVYETPTLLAIGLKAASDPPRLIALHDCDSLEQLQWVIDVVRAEGQYEFEMLLPQNC